MNTDGNEKSCFFASVSSDRDFSHHPVSEIRSVPLFCRICLFLTAAEIIIQLTHYVTEAETVCVCVFIPNGGEAPSSANNLLYSIMATERTAREKRLPGQTSKIKPPRSRHALESEPKLHLFEHFFIYIFMRQFNMGEKCSP